jgi:hypothetical protein
MVAICKVAYVASYLLGDKKVHLSDIYFRADDETNSFWSEPAVPGARFGADKPMYVLTSGETFDLGCEPIRHCNRSPAGRLV